MLYTVGNKETYDAALKGDGRNPIKVGERPSRDYPGGCVFRSMKRAYDYCPDGYDVYGVAAAPDEVEEAPDKAYDHLKNDAVIIKL